MSELANATFPFSGLNRKAGLGSIPLEKYLVNEGGNATSKERT